MKRAVLAAFAAVLLSLPPVLAQEGAANPDVAEIVQRQTAGRALEAAIWGLPAVNTRSSCSMRRPRSAPAGDVVYLGRPLDWHNQTLTPNPEPSI